MDNKRLEFHEQLKTFMIKNLGVDNVYFQPPENLLMKYPCIVYHLATINTRHADDAIYKMDYRYDIKLIELEPDTGMATKFLTEFPKMHFGTPYNTDGLYHSPFEGYKN